MRGHKEISPFHKPFARTKWRCSRRLQRLIGASTIVRNKVGRVKKISNYSKKIVNIFNPLLTGWKGNPIFEQVRRQEPTATTDHQPKTADHTPQTKTAIMTDSLQKDRLFRLAEHYIEDTNVSLFLTGKAGTGKTTFLRHITESTTKRFVVLAPTGVAAVNARGTTIHSFFSLPLCPYLPDVPELKTEYQMPEQYRRLKKEKVKIIKTIDLLIIDEVSMVRADLLDAVDMTLRRYRRSGKPFGGVQLLLIGDAQQLSPEGIIVMGNEGNGISAPVRQRVNRPLLIPSFRQGDSAESLNVAVATAITCSEFRRNAPKAF